MIEGDIFDQEFKNRNGYYVLQSKTLYKVIPVRNWGLIEQPFYLYVTEVEMKFFYTINESPAKSYFIISSKNNQIKKISSISPTTDSAYYTFFKVKQL